MKYCGFKLCRHEHACKCEQSKTSSAYTPACMSTPFAYHISVWFALVESFELRLENVEKHASSGC